MVRPPAVPPLPRRLTPLLVLLGLLVPALSGAQAPPGLDAVDLLELPPRDHDLLRARDAAEAGPGVAPRYAEPVDVDLTPESRGSWQVGADGEHVWRLRVHSPAAVSLSLGFLEYHMPAGGELRISSVDGKHRIRAFTAADNKAHGVLWTPLLPVDELLVEARLPADRAGDLRLRLGRVLHGYKPFGRVEKSGSCNVDVICPDGDGWRDQIRSVAVIGTGSGTFCSGFLVNNSAQDLTPYFMTAFHCGISAGAAPSLVVYWNYENSTCRPPGSPQSGQPGDGTLDQFQTGSVLRAASSDSDFTLVEMDQDPLTAWNVHWAGWDRSSGDFAGAIAIHHPSTDEKRISFENDPTTTTSYLGTTVPGAGTHIRVEDWDVGTTEGGSSGSPLFSPAGHVVGQLHGGFAACGNDLADWYGRISVSWTGGGTAATRLSDWLDPLATGVMTLDGRDAAPDFGITVTPATVSVCSGNDAVYSIDLTSTLGFSEPVTLGVSGNPAGTSVGYGTNPLVPPGSTSLTIGNTAAAAPGTYPLSVSGTAASAAHGYDATLMVADGVAAAPALTAPADGAVDQPVDVSLEWGAIAGASTYDVQVATDAAFTTVVAEAMDVAGTSWQATGISGSGEYFWRVRSSNGCGDGAWSSARSFSTVVLPGDCPTGLLAEGLWLDDLEGVSPPPGGPWTHGGTGSTWTLSGTNTHSGAQAYHAEDVAVISDQRLVSPPIVLPSDRSPLTLQFWNDQIIESSTGGCFDGAVLEISTDGSTWTRLEAELLTDPYDGTISDQYQSPLANENAWCGDPQAWMLSIVDIDAWAGSTVQFRFRLATDESVGREGWTIDDIAIRGCASSTDIFADDFEVGDWLAWSSSTP